MRPPQPLNVSGSRTRNGAGVPSLLSRKIGEVYGTNHVSPLGGAGKRIIETESLN